MADTTKTVDVHAPLSAVYNQWTQFEEFPQFMEGVEQVKQLDDTHLHWKAQIAGQEREWDAEIVEQHPDERVAWRAQGDVENSGVVTFHRIDDDNTRVALQLRWEPTGFVESVGDLLGFVEGVAEGDLKRFKQFIETRGIETGAWRGEVPRTEGPGPPRVIGNN
jgi:uncharacterized membrane protein